jgi:hypothetical protein
LVLQNISHLPMVRSSSNGSFLLIFDCVFLL